MLKLLDRLVSRTSSLPIAENPAAFCLFFGKFDILRCYIPVTVLGCTVQ